jgi:hypothetical protein
MMKLKGTFIVFEVKEGRVIPPLKLRAYLVTFGYRSSLLGFSGGWLVCGRLLRRIYGFHARREGHICASLRGPTIEGLNEICAGARWERRQLYRWLTPILDMV